MNTGKTIRCEQRSSTDAESERGARFGLESGMCKNYCGISTAVFLENNADAAKVKRQSFDKAQDKTFGFAVRSE